MVCYLISKNRKIGSKIMFLWKKYSKDIAVLWLQHDLVIGPKIRPVNVSKSADFYSFQTFLSLRVVIRRYHYFIVTEAKFADSFWIEWARHWMGLSARE